MKRYWVMGLAVLLAGLIFYFYTAQEHSAEADPLEDFMSWPPNATEVRSKLTAGKEDLKVQKALLSEQLTQRFRNHEPRMAVRVKFSEKDPALIDLDCPARMEPWNMDRLAVTVWREAKDDLKRPFNVDIYRTFIGSAPVKAGELRTLPDNPARAVIRYLPVTRDKS